MPTATEAAAARHTLSAPERCVTGVALLGSMHMRHELAAVDWRHGVMREYAPACGTITIIASTSLDEPTGPRDDAIVRQENLVVEHVLRNRLRYSPESHCKRR